MLGWAARLDAAADAALAPYRARWLMEAFLWLTQLGDEPALIGIALAAAGILWTDPRRKGLAAPLWAAFGGVEACVWALKFLVGRARPAFLEGGATAAGPSFPSAHAAVSATVIGFVAYAAGRDLPPVGPARRLMRAAAAGLVALIAFSRVFLGVHYLTDVAAGLVLGVAWLLAAARLAERRCPPQPRGTR